MVEKKTRYRYCTGNPTITLLGLGFPVLNYIRVTLGLGLGLGQGSVLEAPSCSASSLGRLPLFQRDPKSGSVASGSLPSSWE